MVKPPSTVADFAPAKFSKKSRCKSGLSATTTTPAMSVTLLACFWKAGFPEILRIVLLAGGEMDFRCQYVVCKSERETNFYRRTIRTFAFALEMHPVGTGYARSAKRGDVAIGICRFRNKQRQPLMLLQEISIVGREQS